MILRDTFTKWNGESWKPCVLKSGRSKWLYLTWRTASGDSTGFSNIERAVRRKPEKFVCVLPWTPDESKFVSAQITSIEGLPGPGDDGHKSKKDLW